MAARRTQPKTRAARRPPRPPRPLRPGEEPSVFDLAREHRLAPLGHGDATTLAALRGARGDEPWIVELAWDGHRVLACRAGERVRMTSSDFREWSDLFPTVASALQRLGDRSVVVDGWLCALDDQARPSFELLRRHAQKEPARIVFVVWDLLWLDGEDLRGAPLHERRRRLEALLGDGASNSSGARGPALLFSEALAGSLDAILVGIAGIGARGIVTRPASASYPRAPTDAGWLAYGRESARLDFERSLSAPPVVTNQDKLMFPRDRLTKRDVVAYYDEVAPVLLRYLRDRPLVGQRWPDGIDEFTWYQHRMPPRAPDYLRAVWIEENRRIVCEHRDGLVWLANQAVLTFHGWASRCATLAHPDWVVLDLDPGESTTWPQVIEVAVALRKLLELLELPSVPKTSGQKGLHVLIPLAPGHNVIQAHELARRMAKTIAQVLPHLATVESARADRGGRLFVDHLQNFVGKSLVLPYSLRAADGAPVSTPLLWSEVTPKLDPRALNLRTLRDRIARLGDVAEPLLAGTAELAKVIPRLEA